MSGKQIKLCHHHQQTLLSISRSLREVASHPVHGVVQKNRPQHGCNKSGARPGSQPGTLAATSAKTKSTQLFTAAIQQDLENKAQSLAEIKEQLRSDGITEQHQL